MNLTFFFPMYSADAAHQDDKFLHTQMLFEAQRMGETKTAFYGSVAYLPRRLGLLYANNQHIFQTYLGNPLYL